MEENSDSPDKTTLPLILAVALLGMMGGSLVGPVLPAISDNFGIDGGTVGLVITVYAASTALFFPIMGFLTDRYGRRFVLLPALLLNGVAGILAALAPGFPLLLGARALQGVGIAGITPMALILIGDFYSGSEKSTAMGRLSSTRSGGGMLAPIIGGALASLNWCLPFLLYSLSIPLAVIMFFRFPWPDKSETISLRDYVAPLKRAGKEQEVQFVLLLNFFSFFLLYTVVTFIPQHLASEFGVSEVVTGLFLAVQTVATITLAMQSGKLAELAREKYLIGLGFLFSGIGFLLLPTRGVLLWIAFSLLVYGFGRGLYQPQINTLVTDVAPEGRLGGVASANNIAKYGGQMAAPFILGIVKSFYGFTTVFFVSGVVGLVTGIITLGLTLASGFGQS